MFISRWLSQKYSPKERSKMYLTMAFSKRQLRRSDAKTCCSEAGFTLIEIMVVIAIIGILATLIVPKIMGRPDEARAIAAKHDVGTIVQSLKLYRLDVGRYPTTEQGIKSLVEKPTSEPMPQNWKAGGYLDTMPKDPWGNAYQYSNPGTKAEIDVFSYGADGKPGGTGADAEIGNWQQ